MMADVLEWIGKEMAVPRYKQMFRHMPEIPDKKKQNKTSDRILCDNKWVEKVFMYSYHECGNMADSHFEIFQDTFSAPLGMPEQNHMQLSSRQSIL
jgi:hypothetical protein